MSRQSLVPAVLVGALAAGAGTILGLPWAIAGAIVGVAAGMGAAAGGIRPFVAVAVGAGTLGGILVGRGVVKALCLPGSCVELEVAGALITGLGALVGVGLVVALVTRSFDEYHEALAANRPPPEPDHETDENPA